MILAAHEARLLTFPPQMQKEVPAGAQFQGLAMAYHWLGRQTDSDADLEAGRNQRNRT